MASVRILRRAVADLEDACAWYASYSIRAARRFENVVNAAVERIAAHPELYAVVDDRHRLCPLRRSKYVLVYRYERQTDEVVVIALAHGSRDPKTWPSGY